MQWCPWKGPIKTTGVHLEAMYMSPQGIWDVQDYIVKCKSWWQRSLRDCRDAPNLSLHQCLDWVESFLATRPLGMGGIDRALSLRSLFGEQLVCHDHQDLVPSDESTDDSMRSCFVQCQVVPGEFSPVPVRSQVAYHGSHLGCLYSILASRGEVSFDETKYKQANQRTHTQVRGFFCHKHGTRRKAGGYMKYFLVSEHMLVGVLLEMRVPVDHPHIVKCFPDQLCVPDPVKNAELRAVWFHCVSRRHTSTLQYYGTWEDHKELRPSFVSEGCEAGE